jgi:hypothetical protein
MYIMTDANTRAATLALSENIDLCTSLYEQLNVEIESVTASIIDNPQNVITEEGYNGMLNISEIYTSIFDELTIKINNYMELLNKNQQIFKSLNQALNNRNLDFGLQGLAKKAINKNIRQGTLSRNELNHGIRTMMDETRNLSLRNRGGKKSRKRRTRKYKKQI